MMFAVHPSSRENDLALFCHWTSSDTTTQIIPSIFDKCTVISGLMIKT